jgi:hypothetical protein
MDPNETQIWWGKTADEPKLSQTGAVWDLSHLGSGEKDLLVAKAD